MGVYLNVKLLLNFIKTLNKNRNAINFVEH